MSIIYSVQPETFKLVVDHKNGISHNGSFESTHVDTFSARNSFAAFQILLQGTKQTCICLNDDPWFSEYEEAQVVALRHKGQLQPVVNHIMLHLGDDGKEYADCLRRDVVVTTPAGVPQSVFVRFEIPEEIQPGKYDGCFELVQSHLFDDEKVIGRITYSIEVSPFALPAKQDRVFELDLWQLNSSIARHAAMQDWSEDHFRLLETYLKPLAELGQSNITVVASQIPWSGQRCFLEPVKANMFQYSMIPVKKAENGFIYDYSIMDRYIEMCFQYGINRKIEIFGLIGNWVSEEHGYGNYTELPAPIRIRYQDTDGCYRYMKRAKDIKDYIRCLHDHFVEKGWIDKVRVIADEPSDHVALRGILDIVRDIAPGFRYKAAFYKKEFYDEFKDVISDFCIIIAGIGLSLEQWTQIFREDRERCFTYYVCCWPKMPNIMLANDLIETRYIPVFAKRFGLKGFLRWNYTIWPSDPRRDIRYPKWPAGDTNMVYPAPDARPELTLRFMTLRRGAEDYELLHLLEQTNHTDICEELYSSVIDNADVSVFYNKDGEVVTPFVKISRATQKDYDAFRRAACIKLLE